MSKEAIFLIVLVIVIILFLVYIFNPTYNKRIEDPYGVLEHSDRLGKAFERMMQESKDQDAQDKDIYDLELHEQTQVRGHRQAYIVTRVEGGFIYENKSSGSLVFVKKKEKDYHDKVTEILKSDKFKENLEKGVEHFYKRRKQREEALLRRVDTPWFSNLYDLIFSEVTIFDQISDDELRDHPDKYKISMKQFRRFVDIVDLLVDEEPPEDLDYNDEVRIFKHLRISTICGQGCFTTISRNK